VIPSSVDPSQPIDPQLVRDFDIRSPRAADEVKQIADDVWTQNPVILFAEVRSIVSIWWHDIDYFVPSSGHCVLVKSES
jgi:hypothetical protein